MTNQHESGNESNWRAFQYVAGEMSDADRVLFETELADELAAGELRLSEAVARAIEIGQTVQAAEKQAVAVVSLRSSNAWRTRLSWLAGGVLAGAAAIALAAPALRWFDNDQKLAASDPQTAKLAEVWSETAPLSFSTASEEEAEADAAEARNVQIPSWMLAGVRGLADPDAALPRDGELEN